MHAGVRVCCFPSKQMSSIYRIQISPDSFEDWPYTVREVNHISFVSGVNMLYRFSTIRRREFYRLTICKDWSRIQMLLTNITLQCLIRKRELRCTVETSKSNCMAYPSA